MTAGQRVGLALIAGVTACSYAITGAAVWVAWQLHDTRRRNHTTVTLDLELPL